MRIAQVAPLYESVPPQLYGGTERVVSYLTEALVAAGHEVTLFASGDSRTAAELSAPIPRALRLDSSCVDQLAPHIVMLEQVMDRLDEFDAVHWHLDYLHFPASSRRDYPHLTTLHGRLDIPELQSLYDRYSEMPVVSISDNQRRPLPQARWMGTVYHGLPRYLLQPNLNPDDYLCLVGRISPEKGVPDAIRIAIEADMPLRIAAKVDRVDQEYFDGVVRPLLAHPLIEFVGEIDERQKQDFVGNARAMLFPIQWPEPFGMVMIEAMACATPVIAYRSGSVPEVMAHGVSGYIVEHAAEAVAALKKLDTMGRRGVRSYFERRFTAERMATDYIEIYRQLGRVSHDGTAELAAGHHSA